MPREIKQLAQNFSWQRLRVQGAKKEHPFLLSPILEPPEREIKQLEHEKAHGEPGFRSVAKHGWSRGQNIPSLLAG